MTATDDIQVDLAACLVGVFAVLWLTKTDLPQQEPTGNVDLEITIRAATKLAYLDTDGTDPNSVSGQWAEAVYHVNSTDRDKDALEPRYVASAGRPDPGLLLGRMTLVADASSSQNAKVAPGEVVRLPVPSSWPATVEDQAFVDPGSPHRVLLFLTPTTELLSRTFRVTFDPTALVLE